MSLDIISLEKIESLVAPDLDELNMEKIIGQSCTNPKSGSFERIRARRRYHELGSGQALDEHRKEIRHLNLGVDDFGYEIRSKSTRKYQYSRSVAKRIWKFWIRFR